MFLNYKIIFADTIIMRVSYQSPSSHQFDVFFSPQYENFTKGGKLSDIRFYKPSHFSRGGSFLGIMAKILKTSIPFIKSYILPEASNLVQNIVEDVGNEIPVKQSVKKNLIHSMKNIRKKVVRGGNISKKSKNVKKRGKNKSHCGNRSKDIFK